ncbi:MAG: hypothetical protein OEW58_06435 [Gammaproteobacteria bacterium]|nr:hypothetical protein [Gammaproteobacteria bacterium]
MTKLLLTMLTLLMVSPAMAADAEGKPESLQETMQMISADMQSIVKGIGEADYALIADKAKSVAYHKEPPIKQRQALLLELGFELPKFKGHDNDVHAAAMAMKAAAEKKDMGGVIENYGKALNACVACHDGYRERIKAVKW